MQRRLCLLVTTVKALALIDALGSRHRLEVATAFYDIVNGRYCADLYVPDAGAVWLVTYHPTRGLPLDDAEYVTREMLAAQERRMWEQIHHGIPH